MSRVAGLGRQGDWSRWPGVIERETTWRDVWNMDQSKFTFLIRAVTDLLPSPSNLRLWGIKNECKCKLCGSSCCNLRHILSACPESLSGGRYRWRHDHVLKEIGNWLHKVIQSVKNPNPAKKGILNHASDWSLLLDVGRKLQFPREVVATTLRPDCIIVSRTARIIVLVELTVPWEDRLEISHELKSEKYQELVSDIKSNGWNCFCFAVEVGARGFPACSLRYMFKEIGMAAPMIKKACCSAGKAVEDGSRWIWLKRKESWRV